MVNLRYHIVSITAVFLALGIGITMGSSFLGKATLDRIDQNVRNARTEVKNVKAENDVLKKQVSLDHSRSARLTDAAVPRLFNGALTDVPVLVIAADGVDQDSLDNLRATLTASGARFDGTIIATDKLQLLGGDAGRLGTLIGSTSTDPTVLHNSLADAVAAELLAAAKQPAGATGPTRSTTTVAGEEPTTTVVPTTAPTTAPVVTLPTVPGSGPTTVSAPTTTTTTTEPVRNPSPPVITTLIEAGYFDYEPAVGGATLADLLTARGYRYVVVSGSSASISDSDFVIPLLHAMTADGPAPVVVASAAIGDDPEADRAQTIGPLLKDAALSNRITTVDDLELFNGLAAVVLSIQDLDRNLHGHYGVGDGAKTQLPAARG